MTAGDVDFSGVQPPGELTVACAFVKEIGVGRPAFSNAARGRGILR